MATPKDTNNVERLEECGTTGRANLEIWAGYPAAGLDPVTVGLIVLPCYTKVPVSFISVIVTAIAKETIIPSPPRG